MREKEYIITIGSANMDVAGYSHASLNYADSNPGRDADVVLLYPFGF